MYLVVFYYWGEPVPYLELFGRNQSKKTPCSNKQCAVGAAEVTVWSCLTRTDDQTKLVAGHSLGLIVTGGIQHGHHKATRTAAAIKGSP